MSSRKPLPKKLALPWFRKSPTKLKALGVRVLIERGAGAAAHFPDALYADAEFSDAATILASADVMLKVQPPSLTEVAALKKGAVIIGFMQAYARPDLVQALKERGITGFAMELVPRISRAQSMDALSSQASVAGYKAAVDRGKHPGKISAHADHGRRHDSARRSPGNRRGRRRACRL